MRFATLSHLINKDDIQFISDSWIKNDLIVSPEISINDTKGYILGLKKLPKDIIYASRDEIRRLILKAMLYAQDHLDVELIQLGALTTSVTNGGTWLLNQKDYTGYITHGDSYTAAVTCQATIKLLDLINKEPKNVILAIIGSYGIIGEAISKIFVSQFKHTILIGRRDEKLREQAKKLKGNFETKDSLDRVKKADIVITATSHPEALLKSNHLKENAIVVDVSQPSNLSLKVCQSRPDIIRIDGGLVDFPNAYRLPIPGLPPGKNLACITESIMQAMEKDKNNYVGSINLNHLKKTEIWAKKYGFTLNELTNFGKAIKLDHKLITNNSGIK
jgi:predicted amino acid dehydrogenase